MTNEERLRKKTDEEWMEKVKLHMKEKGAIVRVMQIRGEKRFCVFGDFLEDNGLEVPEMYHERIVHKCRSEKGARQWCERNGVTQIAYEGRGG